MKKDNVLLGIYNNKIKIEVFFDKGMNCVRWKAVESEKWQITDCYSVYGNAVAKAIELLEGSKDINFGRKDV